MASMYTVDSMENICATLSVRTGDTRAYVEQMTPPRELIVSATLGATFPLHVGTSSRAFLSFLPEEEFDVYMVRNGKKLTALTERFARELQHSAEVLPAVTSRLSMRMGHNPS